MNLTGSGTSVRSPNRWLWGGRGGRDGREGMGGEVKKGGEGGGR